MQWLKGIIGDELYQKVEEYLDGKKLIINDGSFIPREKFNSVNDEAKSLKEQIKERDKQLKELKDKVKDNEELTTKIEELEQVNETTKEEFEGKIKNQNFNFNLELKLRDLEAKNPKAVKALLDLDKIKFDEDSKQFLGLDEQIKSLKENESYLFGEDTLRGKKPQETNTNTNSYKGKNPYAKDSFNLTEQAKLMRENPELAKALKAQAK